MNIQRFSRLLNVSAHTIRYYEKIGVLRHVARNASGHRFFTSKDLDWMAFVQRLKDMGMPLDKIKHYADLREQGDVTAELRKQLLQEHVALIEAKIALETEHLEKIKDKILYYDQLIHQAVKA
ncbi:transcriptional regulator, MerR family [Marinomonas posidonica IVIA-Po-181]|uniref:Transcriptional regulator, MerR family n=1 Tax=Marinomonas posidonica (strain CECT 7376 / NCIMB 14433 / IVIA-Po-181) TaxID=491952 RepID=F6CUX0_MARPP|nr:transcriptional regulator, MerR family [Marinomonas posidonica IVIA-Po-181]